MSFGPGAKVPAGLQSIEAECSKRHDKRNFGGCVYMTAEEMLRGLFDQYGEDFNWYLVPQSQSNGALVEELKREMGEGHVLSHKNLRAIAKCGSNDDVLYVAGEESGTDAYYIFHLTYAKQNLEGFPRHEKFADLLQVKEFIEQAFIENY